MTRTELSQQLTEVRGVLRDIERRPDLYPDPRSKTEATRMLQHLESLTPEDPDDFEEYNETVTLGLWP